ncbi:MAG: IS982 family transposase, partial [Acidobacteria bacterium]|nr:IS982 family transposase [Acidobacteriota bacterium]
MMLIDLFCAIDDFCQEFEPQWNQMLLANGVKQRQRASNLSLSEVMTIIVRFHQSGYRTFKDFYTKQVVPHHQREFPHLVSYARFVELMASAFVPLTCFLNTRKGQMTGIAFIDSTAIAVCHNRRIASNQVFAGLAKRGKTSMGWFYGFKLHLVVNDTGEILALKITPGNIDDRAPVPDLTQRLIGKLFGDRGYVSHPLFVELFERGLQLITRVKKSRKECRALMPMFDKILLRKRAVIESVNDQLKNQSQIEHSRHRSPTNFMVNL